MDVVPDEIIAAILANFDGSDIKTAIRLGWISRKFRVLSRNAIKRIAASVYLHRNKSWKPLQNVLDAAAFPNLEAITLNVFYREGKRVVQHATLHVPANIREITMNADCLGTLMTLGNLDLTWDAVAPTLVWNDRGKTILPYSSFINAMKNGGTVKGCIWIAELSEVDPAIFIENVVFFYECDRMHFDRFATYLADVRGRYDRMEIRSLYHEPADVIRRLKERNPIFETFDYVVEDGRLFLKIV